MALRLVRQTSETPNITNKDDTIMTRYAYGGYNGVVKGFGSECRYTDEGGVFKISDGRIVIDGWEIDVDGAGWILDLSGISGIRYYSIYVSINVFVESVNIEVHYDSNDYTDISKGDDLTEIPNGTARLLLYHVKVENGVITEGIARFNLIPYLAQKVLDLEKRLDELGFKQGDLVDADANITYKNAISKMGYYCLIQLKDINIKANPSSAETIRFKLPQEFVPEFKEVEGFEGLTYPILLYSGFREMVQLSKNSSSGDVYLNISSLALSLSSYTTTLSFGYKLKGDNINGI